MPKEIWNEGRVVGYSAYEIYVKQHLAEDPDHPPASEREWLASSLAMGASMLLHVPLPAHPVTSEDDHTFIDIPLPRRSNLAAANTVVASFFDGDANLLGNSDTWASSVTSYGQLIADNISGKKVEVLTGDISASSDSLHYLPTKQLGNLSKATLAQLRDYMKIVDGVILQPGTWSGQNNSSSDPVLLNPELYGDVAYPLVRLQVKGKFSTRPWILLTGFTIRSVLSGITKAEGYERPEDGDFLGPGAFPWASKIIFSVPTSYIAYFLTNSYKRTLPSDQYESPSSRRPVPRIINDTAVIDMQSGYGMDSVTSELSGADTHPVLEKYYSTSLSSDELFYPTNSLVQKRNSRIANNVSDFNTLGEGVAVLTVYQKKQLYPPALYGTLVSHESDNSHDNYLHPIDIVAPGSIKMFHDATESELLDYQQTFPGTTAMDKFPDGTISILNEYNKIIKVANLDTVYAKNSNDNFAYIGYPNTMSGYGILASTNRPELVRIRTGHKSVYALAFSSGSIEHGGQGIADGFDSGANEPNEPKQLVIDPEPIDSIRIDRFTTDNENINWSTLIAALVTNSGIDILNERLKKTKDTLTRPHGTSSTGGVADGPYIEFGSSVEGSNIRLYISNEQPDPTDIPIGSIGIGWNFDYESYAQVNS